MQSRRRVFPLEVGLKENSHDFFCSTFFVACGPGILCVPVCFLVCFFLCHCQPRFYSRTDDDNCSCSLLMRNRFCFSSVSECILQSSLFALFSPEKVMGRKKRSFLRKWGNKNLFLAVPPVSSGNLNLFLKN